MGVLWRLVDAGGLAVLRICPGCAGWFANRIRRGRPREYCSAKCQSRVKVARWRAGRRASQPLSAEQTRKIRQLRRKGWAYYRISKELGIPLRQVFVTVELWPRKA